MARVGIGVPVYNGSRCLAESLECLRTQTFEDFEVVIGDNASDDATADICAAIAARDSRFHHLRRTENVGSLPNFQGLRDVLATELFCWRAYDDLSAPDFLQHLVAEFDADPATRLAVCRVRTVVDDRTEPRVVDFRPPPGGRRINRIRQQMFSSHASWIYGLWHREALAELQDRVHRDYPHVWGWDHLTLLPVILDGAVRGTNQTEFVQRILRDGSTWAERRAKLPGVAAMRALRTDFDRVARAILAERDWTIAERVMFRAVFPSYVDRRGYGRAKLMRRALRHRLGIGAEKA